MKRTTLSIATLAVMLASPNPARGQTAPLVPAGGVATTITFEMQLNLTNLANDLERVRLFCTIASAAYSWTSSPSTESAALQLPGHEVYVVQGKVAATLSVQFPVATAYLAPDAVGKQANYMCMLVGYSTSLQRWNILNDQQTNATFRISPAPPSLVGSFVW